MLFITLTHQNNGDERTIILNAEEIVSVGSLRQKPINLFDENGELVRTEPNTEPREYVVVLKNGFKFFVKEEEYTRLLALLVK